MVSLIRYTTWPSQTGSPKGDPVFGLEGVTKSTTSSKVGRSDEIGSDLDFYTSLTVLIS